MTAQSTLTGRNTPVLCIDNTLPVEGSAADHGVWPPGFLDEGPDYGAWVDTLIDAIRSSDATANDGAENDAPKDTPEDASGSPATVQDVLRRTCAEPFAATVANAEFAYIR